MFKENVLCVALSPFRHFAILPAQYSPWVHDSPEQKTAHMSRNNSQMQMAKSPYQIWINYHDEFIINMIHEWKGTDSLEVKTT